MASGSESLQLGEGWISPGRALELIAAHFLSIWKGKIRLPPRKQREVRERMGGQCEAPCCTRMAEEAHHIVFRSHQGPNETFNLLGLCKTCHQVCIHKGCMRVTGQAPDSLVWEMGIRPDGGAPLIVVRQSGGEQVIEAAA